MWHIERIKASKLLVKWHTKRYALLNWPHQKSTHFIWKHTGGALPFVGGYQVPVNRPPFSRLSYTQYPLSLLSYHDFTNWKYLGPLCAFWEIYTFCGNFDIKFANFGLKIAVLHTNWPPFWGIYIKKIPVSFFLFLFFFFWAPTEWPLVFSMKSYTEYPLLSFSDQHLCVTFMFECPPGKQSIIFLK